MGRGRMGEMRGRKGEGDLRGRRGKGEVRGKKRLCGEKTQKQRGARVVRGVGVKERVKGLRRSRGVVSHSGTVQAHARDIAWA